MSAFFALIMGVSLSERPDVQNADMLTKAYYSLGLFVMGGLDIGTPVGGPLVPRLMLWLSYFASPMLAASTIIEAVVKTISPYKWRFRRIRNHIVVVGSGELTITYLKQLRLAQPKIPLLVICDEISPIREEELKRRYHAIVVTGDITRSYFLSKLFLHKAIKVLLLGQDNFQNYEAAHKMLQLQPSLEGKIIIHCNSIRFMRSMADSQVAQRCINFNAYQLAASALVQQHLIAHFVETIPKDVVVIAGFGIFGQTILEELQHYAQQEIETIAIIGIDAKRRIQVADEQLQLGNFCKREIFEGNISHPEVWQQLRSKVDLTGSQPIIILCTDSVEDNFRTSLWLKNKYPDSMIIARSYLPSKFAENVGEQNNILNVSINQLVKDNIPKEWMMP
ncbi:MAG: hypothetical protein ACJAVV_003426 [Alphaproteobacteria bacterium]|jgi:hypothetical protein